MFKRLGEHSINSVNIGLNAQQAEAHAARQGGHTRLPGNVIPGKRTARQGQPAAVDAKRLIVSSKIIQ